MISTKRRAAAVLAGAVLVTTLTGCQTVGSLVDQTRISVALQQLTTEVESHPGLSLSYPDPELQADYSYQVYLTMTATDAATEGGITAAMLAARDTVTDGVFDGAGVGLTLDAKQRGQVSVSDRGITEQKLSAELAYWLELQRLVSAPVSVTLGATEGEGGGAYQNFSFDTEADAAAMRAIAAVPAPSSASRSWSLPGLEASGSLPDGAGLQLFSTLGSILPPANYWSDEAVHGSLMYWAGDGRVVVSVTLVGQEPASIAESEDWPLVLQALSATVASGLPATFSVQPDQSLGGVSVRWGQCEHPWALPEIDEAFFTLLQPHGLPVDAEPGGC